MNVLGWALAVGTGLVVLDRIGVWAEQRGWVYWRQGRGAAGGAALGEIIDVLQPTRRHLVEQQEHERLVADQPESGDGPSSTWTPAWPASCCGRRTPPTAKAFRPRRSRVRSPERAADGRLTP